MFGMGNHAHGCVPSAWKPGCHLGFDKMKDFHCEVYGKRVVSLYMNLMIRMDPAGFEQGSVLFLTD